jgi:DNA modification methylase
MLASEADVLRTLRDGTYTLQALYALCEESTDVERDGGHDAVPGHPGDVRWKRRVRGALQALRARGRAQRIARSRWALQGTPQRPQRLLLIIAGGALAEIELRLQAAVELLATLDQFADLVLTDPPYGLRRGHGRFADGHGYRRDHTRVIGGYVDVGPSAYEAFTIEWVSAAARALRHGGQLAVVTGPQRAAAVQTAAQHAGLTWVTSIAARRSFALYTRRRPACAHWTITVMCRGALAHPRRVFNPPDDLPTSRAGNRYPLDWWEANGRADRPGQIRNDCELPLRLVRRIVMAFSDPGELVVDPFLGAGSALAASWQTSRRFTGGDLNARALVIAAARLLDEHAWPADRQPTLLAS